MKKTLTFIPLGIGISAAIIYLFNVIQFRIINNSVSLFQILSNLKIYLYICIGSFIFYFLLRVLLLLKDQNKNNVVEKEIIKEETNEPIVEEETTNYTPNYDYVPLYKENKTIVENKENMKHCLNCGTKLKETDNYCFNCGVLQDENNKQSSKLIKSIINVLEIVILILILYFSLVTLFDFKASRDPSFTSPFRISMTK